MNKKFETVIQQSEQANDLLKKIESTLVQSRKELAENLKKMDVIVADIPKIN